MFRDTDSLHPGDHYPDKIRRALRQSDIVLALIGPEWLTLRDSDGRRLIDRERDWVRAELADAFEHNIPVIPVLLVDAPCPAIEDLPASISRLARIQVVRVGLRSFGEDLEKLARALTDRVPHLALPQVFDRPAGPSDTRLPSGLLRPEYGLVPSGGRAVDLDRLHAWAENPDPVSAQHDVSDAIADLLASDPPRVLPTAVQLLTHLASPPPSLVAAINTTITAKLPAETLIGISRELEPLAVRYLPTLQRVQKALIDTIVPPSEQNPDPATAAVVADLNRFSQGLSQGLSGLFNQDVLRIIALTQSKYE